MIKPIRFPPPTSDDMVRALLDSRKTVTRRVVKPHYRDGEAGFRVVTNAHTGKYIRIEYFDEWEDETRWMTDLYSPGDILYVRETFRIDYLSNISGTGRAHYKADDTYCDFTFAPGRYEMMRRTQLKPGWRPSENMPREAARIFLRVTDVRVERLQDITEEQVRAEGVEPLMITTDVDKPDTEKEWHEWGPALPGFIDLWHRAMKTADRALYGWDANPWVWVIKFERISKEEAVS